MSVTPVCLRPHAAFPLAALSFFAGCAVAAPSVENDPFFDQNAEEDGAVDADTFDAATDPTLMGSGPIDSGNVLPPFGTPGGASFGGGATLDGGLAGTPGRDAGALSSGLGDASTSAPRDAGGTRPPATTFDASAPVTGTCDPFACTNECSLAGPIPCCTLLDTCGCTWAPGAYCL